MRKRGELTSSQIIKLVLALGGFIIVLFFLFFFIDLSEQTDEEICRLSVLTRATVPEVLQKYVPLKCQTRKICLSSNRKGCENFVGEENVAKTIELPRDSQAAADLIEETSANAMLSCWSMMGEGKLSLYSGGFAKFFNIKPDQLTCTICSRIIVNIPDDAKKQEVYSLVDLKDFMDRTTVPGSSTRTYLEAFTDVGVNFEQSPQTIEINDKRNFIFEGSQDELAVVFTQIKPDDYQDALTKLGVAGATAAGSAFAVPGVRSLAIGTVTSAPGAILVGVAAAGVTTFTMLNVRAGRVAAAGYCGEFTGTDDKAMEGCSTVQIIPYEEKTIETICDAFEGSP